MHDISIMGTNETANTSFPTMKSGDWVYQLPRYLRSILKNTELGDGEHSSADFIEKIQEVNYVFTHEEDFPLLFEVGKLLLIEFAKMSESVISLSNLKESVEPQKDSVITNREDIDLVERALPQPMIEND